MLFTHIIGPIKLNYCVHFSVTQGYRQKDYFIATQGPLTHTVEDFWRMVWEWKCHSIVMLTELQEREQVSCNNWWLKASDGWSLQYPLQHSFMHTCIHNPSLFWYLASVTKHFMSVYSCAFMYTFHVFSCFCLTCCWDIKQLSLFLQDKCCQYWPTEDSATYGDYTVELKGDTLCDTFSLRDLVLTFIPVSKLTYHYHTAVR